MPIKDVQKDLDQRESEVVKREHDRTDYDVWKFADESKDNRSGWETIKDTLFDAKVRALMIGGAIFIAVIILASAIFAVVYYQKGFFAQERVTLSSEIPATVNSNETISIVFSYMNNNRAYIDNAEITVNFGDYFIPGENQENFRKISDKQGILSIGRIEGGAQGSTSLMGHFAGPTGSVNNILGSLAYIPEKTSVEYKVSASSATTISSSPIIVDMIGPTEVISGNKIDVSIVVKNSNSSKVSDLKLVLQTPKNFVLTSSEPASVSDNTWLIDSIAPGKEYIMSVRGTLSAPSNTVQAFRMEVSAKNDQGQYVSYANGKYAPVMLGSPVTIQQKILNNEDGVVRAGDRLYYEISFYNNSSVALRDAVLKMHFDTKVLDFSELSLKSGAYDEKNKIITWKASDLPALKVLNPTDSGSLTFSVSVLEKLPVETLDDHSFSVTTSVSIDSEDISSSIRDNKIISSNTLNTPIAAKVLIEGSLRYKEGAWPPTVGEKTIYDITIGVNNINNDVNDALLIMPLPTYIEFEEGPESIEVNQRTNIIRWNIGSIKHGAGITSDSVQVNFSASIVPSSNQIGEFPVIIKESTFTAKDSFANVDIRKNSATLTILDEDRGRAQSKVH